MKKIVTFIVSLFLSFNLLADIEVTPQVSQQIWKAVDLISKVENLPLIHGDEQRQYLELDKIECVFDYYEACSFFSYVSGQRKLIVTTEGSIDFIRALGRAGVREDQENLRIEARNLKCDKVDKAFNCYIIEY